MPKESVLVDNLEVCRLLGVHPSTWRSRVQSGAAPLPHARMGARCYYRRGDVEHFVREGRWPEGMRFRDSQVKVCEENTDK
jgi:hypothetical protein